MSSNYQIANVMSAIFNIRNVNSSSFVVVPYSNFSKEVLKVLVSERYLKGFQVIGDGCKKSLRIELAFRMNGVNIVSGFKLYSKPSIRRYTSLVELESMCKRYGSMTFVISTSSGILSAERAIDARSGGELICSVF